MCKLLLRTLCLFMTFFLFSVKNCDKKICFEFDKKKPNCTPSTRIRSECNVQIEMSYWLFGSAIQLTH